MDECKRFGELSAKREMLDLIIAKAQEIGGQTIAQLQRVSESLDEALGRAEAHQDKLNKLSQSFSNLPLRTPSGKGRKT